MPRFLVDRNVYERHERPSRTYSRQVFILSNVISEIPSQSIMALIAYLTWYYPTGLYRTGLATESLNARGALTFFFLWSYMIFSSTFAQLVGSIIPDAATGINVANLLFMLSTIFCGILVNPSALPGFCLFMWRVSPVSYFASGLATVGMAGVAITCRPEELATMDPPTGTYCDEYLGPFLKATQAVLINPHATTACKVCPLSTTSSLLERFGMNYAYRNRDAGLTLCYSVFNIVAMMLLYRYLRVKKVTTGERPD